MNKIIPIVGAISLLTGCQLTESATLEQTATEAASPEKQQVDTSLTESERLNNWFADKYEEELQNSPMMMTFLGRKDKYDQIDDMSVEAQEKQFEIATKFVNELNIKFDYDKLDPEAKVSFDIWNYQYNEAKEARAFKYNGYAFTQMDGMHSFSAQFLIGFHKVESESDMVAYNKRIKGMARAISQLLQRTQESAENGVRPPKFAYDGVIEQSTALVTGQPFTDSENDSALWADAKAKVKALVEAKTIDQAEADKLLSDTKTALLESYLPAYNELISWFKEDIVNTYEVAKGVSTQPLGKKFYKHQLKSSTTTDLTAEQIHEIGLSEVERITNEMIAIKEKVGFDGTLQEFFTFIKEDEQFYYPDTDEGRQAYIDDTEAFYAVIDKQLPNYFGILPKAGFEVKRVEPFREQPGAAAHYYPGSPDGSRKGVYYLHLSDMTAMPKGELESVAYHEGNPGHHMQISIAQELTSVPQFRTQANFNAYSEGWGLYSEWLAIEMGGYEDPYSDFGRLVNEIWRAVRLVVDTGLHSKGWDEKQAIAYFKEKVPTSDTTIISEVRRYIVWPGQATGYKIGMLKIQELRSNAEKALGDKFDIRGFHDVVLGGGAMPLSILERRVNDWVASVK